jgi:hypothetical protein
MDLMTDRLVEQRFKDMEGQIARLEVQVERLRQIEGRRSIDQLRMAGAVFEGLLYGCVMVVLVSLLMNQS